MNIIKTYNRFKACENIFQCPICAAQMAFRNENSLVCSKNHCFDLSKDGYVNFAPNLSKMKYTKDLFESRRRIFQSGFYDPLKENLKCLAKEYCEALSFIRVLDAGCGEGFFISDLLDNDNQTKEIFALDILKGAVVLAAKENNDIKWMVGDLSNIPLSSNAMDLVLNIFAPANYNEFLRVMKDNGFLIKVIPGEEYLKELRECAGEQLINKQYSNRQILQHFQKNVVYLDKKHLFYQLPVTENHLESFIKMTPLMFNVDRLAIKPDNIQQITIDVEIVVGRKQKRDKTLICGYM